LFKNLNHDIESNYLVEHFSPIFKFTQFNDGRSNSFYGLCYTAKTEDKTHMNIHYNHEYKDSKIYISKAPSVTFEHYQKRTNHKITPDDLEKVNTIANHFNNWYKPNFDKMIAMVKLFINQGLNSGIYRDIDFKDFQKHSSSFFIHYNFNEYLKIVFNHQTFAHITFNNVLQTLRAGQQDYKKSHINIDILYLVKADKSVAPYFRVRLPYTAHRKVNWIISFDCSEMYITSTEHDFRKNYLDELEVHPTNDEYINNLFENIFNDEVIKGISKALKIKRADLKKLNQAELRDYMTLADMVKC